MDSSLGKLALWVLDETNIIVTSTTAAWLVRCVLHEPDSYTTHPAGAMWFVAGACSAAVVAKILKQFLREARPLSHKPSPSSSALYSKLPDAVAQIPSYGMPSTHSTTIFFFTTYIFNSTFPSNRAFGALLGGTTIAWSRIALGHHTGPQVIAGVVLGIVLGTSHWAGWNGMRAVGWAGLRGSGEGYWDLAEYTARRVWAEM